MKKGIIFILSGVVLLFGVSIAMHFGDIWKTFISFPTSHIDWILAILAGGVLMALIDWLSPSRKAKKKPHNNEEQ